MFQLEEQLKSDYLLFLRTTGIKSESVVDYLKWLRFFLDFCGAIRG